MVTFDDGRLGVAAHAWPMMTAEGMRGNVAVMGARYWDQQLPWDVLAAMRDAGWSVVAHSMTHPALTAIPRDSAAWEIAASRRVIDSLGFDPHVFIVPYLLYDAEVMALVRDAGFDFARCCVQEPRWSPDTLLDWPIRDAARYALVGVDVTDYGAGATYDFRTAGGRAALGRLVDDGMARGKFVEVVFHEITPADTAALRATLALLRPHRRRMITFAELRR